MQNFSRLSKRINALTIKQKIKQKELKAKNKQKEQKINKNLLQSHDYLTPIPNKYPTKT